MPLTLTSQGRSVERLHARLAKGLQLSAEAVDTARWLLQHMPQEHHLALCDLVPEAAIVKWADARRVLYVEVLQERWGCSRASAYRWIAALGRQNGAEARLQ